MKLLNRFFTIPTVNKILCENLCNNKKKQTYSNASMFKKLQGQYNSKPKKEYYPEEVSEEFSKNIRSISEICISNDSMKCIFMTQ